MATKLLVIKGDLDCYRQKLQEVYQWRHNVFRRERDVANIHPLNAADIELLGRSPDHGGLQLEYGMSPYFFGFAICPTKYFQRPHHDGVCKVSVDACGPRCQPSVRHGAGCSAMGISLLASASVAHTAFAHRARADGPYWSFHRLRAW